MLGRRRILTGLIAAPFVARMGLLMPVRRVEPLPLVYGSYPAHQWLRHEYDAREVARRTLEFYADRAKRGPLQDYLARHAAA